MNNFNNHWTNKQVLEFEQFLQNYNIEFKKDDLFLFQQAFIHPSYAYENQLNYNYQKLEFYGDALIEKEISSYLFNKNNLTEGQMTLDRIKMVNHNSLTKLAKALHFEKFILVGNRMDFLLVDASFFCIMVRSCFNFHEESVTSYYPFSPCRRSFWYRQKCRPL